MAQFIVRNLEDDVKARLKRRAARHGRSMEEEARHITTRRGEKTGSTCSQAGVTHCSAFRESGPDHRAAGITRSTSAIRGIR